MGTQPSTLNCKVNDLSQKNNQVTPNKEFFGKQRIKQYNQQTDTQPNPQSQNVMANMSPSQQLTRATSQRNLSTKSSRQLVKQKMFIPQHQAITKVAETPFRLSVKEKKLFVQEKVKSLAEIVESRYNTTKHFPYSQMLGLLESLVYGLAYMTKKNCNHHDFYPTNIYYSDGRFKIINPLEIQASGFYLTSQRQRFSFLSPELIIAILQESQQTQVGQEIMSKSDVFAVGMILLQCCSLQPSSECYDEESYNIVDSVIKERLAKVAKIYTAVMAECVNMMLQYEIQGRVEPIALAQLVHARVEGQKSIAMQMEAPKPQGFAPQQQGQPGQRVLPPQGIHPQGLPPNIMPPQQMRGPPPPPYMHQSFKMQNLNQNVIAVSMPNEQFTRIGPNNQGFLSSSSLQQKLRVIELIKESPREEDEDVESESKVEQSVVQEPRGDVGNVGERKFLFEKELVQPKPQYPLVESIYSQKPLVQGYAAEFDNNVRPVNVMQPLVMTENKQIIPPPYQPPSQFNRPQMNTYQQQQYQQQEYQQQRRVQQFITQEQRVQVRQEEQRKVIMLSSEEMRRQAQMQMRTQAQLEAQMQAKLQAERQAQMQVQQQRLPEIHLNGGPMKTISDLQMQQQPTQFPLSYQPLPRNKQQQPQKYVSSYSYVTTTTVNSVKNSPTINNIYTNNQSIAKGLSSQQDEMFGKKYGTSFQNDGKGETIDERVQRVLNMSRNAK